MRPLTDRALRRLKNRLNDLRIHVSSQDASQNYWSFYDFGYDNSGDRDIRRTSVPESWRKAMKLPPMTKELAARLEALP